MKENRGQEKKGEKCALVQIKWGEKEALGDLREKTGSFAEAKIKARGGKSFPLSLGKEGGRNETGSERWNRGTRDLCLRLERRKEAPDNTINSL